MELFLLFLLIAAIGLIVAILGAMSRNDKMAIYGGAALVIGLALAFTVAFVELRDLVSG